MKPAIHLLHPVQSPGVWEKMRCGLRRNKDHDIYQTTTDPAQVTCIKCKGYISNPWRSLRNYGFLTIIENEAIALIHGNGYNLDIIAVNDFTGTWTLVYADNVKNSLHTSVKASSMTDLGNKLLELYETELINFAR